MKLMMFAREMRPFEEVIANKQPFRVQRIHRIQSPATGHIEMSVERSNFGCSFRRHLPSPNLSPGISRGTMGLLYFLGSSLGEWQS